ncbi:hypothetical protein [Thomasclavelia cocleata]|uniref:hypothetical protein n=1 Tax=Thomasclavelia cocleata TaxID=69824 RepID=UPI0024314B1F|nr:hypothetical protein [Thomasclavelia cocleata]
MRKCHRCNTEMIEEYGLKISSINAGVASVMLSKGQGVFTSELGNAVCPKCGEVSLYTENKKILDK